MTLDSNTFMHGLFRMHNNLEKTPLEIMLEHFYRTLNANIKLD